jgi:peptide/nickel transport system substrate-binding protein
MGRLAKGAAGAAALLLLALTTGTGVGVAADDTAAPDQTVLRVGVGSEIANPNLWAVNSVAEWSAVTLQYDMMRKFSDEDLSAAPSLAESCEPSNGARVWTCTIRSGITWSDGEPFTSRDIAFTYEFVQDKQFPYFRSYIPEGSTFETPDDQTLVWRSEKPTFAPDVPPWIYIVPEHVWSKYADADIKEIKAADVLPVVSTGPYTMTQATPGQNWTFTKNPNYWGDEPTYDTIRYIYYTNQEAMVQALRQGEIDIADELTSDLLPALESQPNIAVQKVTADCWVNLAFNFGGQGPASDPLPALQDLTVRKAIALAIDKQAIVDKVYPDAAVPGETIIRPLAEFWHLDIPDDDVIPFDPDAANQLLDDAGYARGPDGVRVDPANGEPLKMRLPVSGDTVGSEGAGKLIAGFLGKIGIDVDVQPVTAGKMYDIQQTGDFDGYIWYWCGDPDPDYQLSVFTSDQCGDLSDGCWQDATFDAMYREQRSTTDQAKRQQIVFDMQQYVYDQIPAIPLVYPNSIQAYRSDQVTGLTPTPASAGYITPTYVNTSFVTARPASSSAGNDSSNGLPPWLWVVLIAAVGIGGFALYRRSGRQSDEEG